MTPAHEHLGLAIKLADCARGMLAGGARQWGGAQKKDDGSPVTEADRSCERAMREIITEACPEHGIWGEEFGAVEAATTWVLDPIDGTKAFITGSPLFATLIGLIEDGRPTLGIIEMPALGQRWVGASGETPRKSRDAARELALANIAITRPAKSDACALLLDSCAQIRYGGDAFNFAAVADGTLDIAIDEGLAPYDYAALLPVLEAAGCYWSDFSGANPAFGGSMDLVAAANRSLLDEAVATLASPRTRN